MRLITRKLYASFCSQNSTLLPHPNPQVALQAVWAERFFTEILNHSQQDKILVDYLQSLTLPQHNVINAAFKEAGIPEISQGKRLQVEKKMKMIFQPYGGANLPIILTNTQRRFSQAKNKNSKFSFFPNSYITPILFQAIQNNAIDELGQIIIGSKGISKSSGLLLGCYLSSVSTLFRFGKTQMVAKLVQKNLLRASFPKLLYISFTAKGKINYSYFANLLKFQCPELSDLFKDFKKQNPIGDLITEDSFQKLLSLMKQKYQDQNINCLVIMDQINTLAKLFHNANKIKTLYPKPENQDTQQKRILKSCQRFNFIYTILKRDFNCLYNSSTNIEVDILTQSSNMTADYRLDMKGHSRENTVYIDVKGKTYDPRVKKEIYQFIWYCCSKYLTTQKAIFYENKFIECLKTLPQIAQENTEIPLWVTPLSIRTAVQDLVKKSESTLLQLNSSGIKNIQVVIKKIVDEVKEQVENQGIRSLQDKAKNYLNDADISFKKIKFLIHLAWATFFQDQKKNPLFKDMKILKVPLDKIKEYYSGDNQTIEKYINKDLFKVEKSYIVSTEDLFKVEKTYLVSIVSMQQLGAVSLSWLWEKEPDLTEKTMNQISDSSAAGRLIEQNLIKWLEANPQASFRILQQLFPRQKFSTFLHFHGKKNKQNLSYNLSKMLLLAKDLALQAYVFGKPQTAASFSQKIGHTSANSPSFDFMGLRYKSLKELEIVTFDITISTSQIKKKIEDAVKLIQQLMGNHQLYIKKKSQQEYRMAVELIKLLINYNTLKKKKDNEAVELIYKFINTRQLNKDECKKALNLIEELINNDQLNKEYQECSKMLELIKQLINNYYLQKKEVKDFIILKWRHFILGKEQIMSVTAKESTNPKISISLQNLKKVNWRLSLNQYNNQQNYRHYERQLSSKID